MLKKVVMIAIGILIILLFVYFSQDRTFIDFYPRDQTTTIKQFTNNYEDFSAVQQYAHETNGLLYVSESRWRFKENNIENTGDGLIEDPIIKKMFNSFLSKLHYQGIYELRDGTIQFIKEAGSDESGIVYSPNKELPFYVLRTVDLGDGWYYYRTIHV